MWREADGATVFGPDTLTLKPFTTTYVYAVGDFFGDTFQYLVFTETVSKPRPGTCRAPDAARSRTSR